jgi:hypothetical protein
MTPPAWWPSTGPGDDPVADPALRQELLGLAGEDQAARQTWIADPSLGDPLIDAIDRRTTLRMQEVIEAHGWPGHRLVGRDGAEAAWLLVQHADHAPEFQRRCLAELERAVASGQAQRIHLAYLQDRVAVRDGRPQRYGTQVDDDLSPLPIEDEAHVDERRRAVGLPSLTEYRREHVTALAEAGWPGSRKG